VRLIAVAVGNSYSVEEETVLPTPAEEIPPLTEQELAALRDVGRHWNAVAGTRLERLRVLPVDPAVGDGALFRPEARDELEATEAAIEPVSRLGRVARRLKRAVIGPPLRSNAAGHQRMRNLVALPVLGSDLFASVSYGPEAMLAVLVLAGARGLDFALPLAGVLIVLMLAVGASYRQTLAAYPSGAGSYVVAGDNLGERAGVTAAVALLVDYILNVAVSIATGIAAVTSAVPSLAQYTVVLGLGMIALLLVGNLRGVREAGRLFAAPTYVFLVAMGLLICTGLAQAGGHGFKPTPPPPLHAVEGLTVLLVLRAFSSGATSMTGIEAIANAVPAFHPPEWRNARRTMTWMIAILVTVFAGLMLLIHLDGIAWKPDETVLSQLAHRSFGGGVLYGFVQTATAVMLLFAANTSYNAFPRLLYVMARNGHAPHQFLHMGDRLVFSHGAVVLSVAAAALFAGFGGQLEALIPLFAVGVFVAVTLSQAGMVVRWWRTREAHWRRGLAINGLGALLTAIVVLVAAGTKLTEGAWVVVVGIPLLVWLCLRVRGHYRTVDEALRLQPLPASAADGSGPAGDHQPVPAPAAAPQDGPERQESPEQIQHLLLVPVERLDLANLRALAYAVSLGLPLLAVHLSPADEEAERFRHEWESWGVALRLEIVVSPHRALVAPLVRYVELLRAQRPELTTTVILSELVVRRPWQRLLHSHLAARLRAALRSEPNVVITAVPFHLPA
jgi:amino acid transporter